MSDLKLRVRLWLYRHRLLPCPSCNGARMVQHFGGGEFAELRRCWTCTGDASYLGRSMSPATPQSIEANRRGDDPQIRVVVPDDPLAKTGEFLRWLTAHDLEPTDIFQVDIVDGYLVAYRYDRNEDGAKYVHREGEWAGRAAIAEPLVRALTEPLPGREGAA